MQHAQVSESPIGTDQALIIVQNQTYPISVQSMIQLSGLAQWLQDLNQLLLPHGSLNFINIQSPLTDFETPESARHEAFFMRMSSSAFETVLLKLCCPELLNVTESNPVELLRAFAYLQCPKFPETYFVRFLPNLDTSTWAKFIVVHSFFMPEDTAIQIHLNNFNLWNVRMPYFHKVGARSLDPLTFVEQHNPVNVPTGTGPIVCMAVDVSNVVNHSHIQKSYAQQNIKIFTEPHVVIIMSTFNAG